MKTSKTLKMAILYSLCLYALNPSQAFSMDFSVDAVAPKDNSNKERPANTDEATGMSTGKKASLLAAAKAAETGAAAAYLTRTTNKNDLIFKDSANFPTALSDDKIAKIQSKAQEKINAQKLNTAANAPGQVKKYGVNGATVIVTPQEPSAIKKFILEKIAEAKRPIVLLKLDDNMLKLKMHEAQQAKLAGNLYDIQKITVEAKDAAKFLDPKYKLVTIDVNKHGGMTALQARLKELKAQGILIPEASVQTWAKRTLLHTGGKIVLVLGTAGALGIYGYEAMDLSQANPDAAYCDAGSKGDVNCAKAVALKKDIGGGRAPALARDTRNLASEAK